MREKNSKRKIWTSSCSTLKVQFPLEFKITRGDWKTECATNENDGDNILISKPIKSKVINLKVIQWFDK